MKAIFAESASHSRRSQLAAALLCGTAWPGILAVSTVAANAQDAPIEQIVVTGTSIRGVPPVGANLISLGPDDIAATGGVTIEQILAATPAISQFGAAGQGQNGPGAYQPTIHNLGSSLSNSTLILIDGHRAPAGGTNHPTIDPNMIPTNMIERIDVLADGSSAIYGADAAAGVINFITRKSFDGIQFTGQSSVLQGAVDLSAGLLVGTSTETSSTVFGYTYTFLGGVNNTAHPEFAPNHIARIAAEGLTGPGQQNFNNFNCSPATIQPNGSGNNYYLSPTATTTTPNSTTNANCNQYAYGQLVTPEARNDVMLRYQQKLGSRITVDADILYANRSNFGPVSAGVLTATAFGTGAQANPFYMNPPGQTFAKQQIRWDANDLLGPATGFSTADTAYADVSIEYNVDDNFVVNLVAHAGHDDSQGGTYNALNASVATLALNGTTNTGGNTTQASIPGTNTAVVVLPLTAANALDVWNPASGNRTSAATIAALRNSAVIQRKIFGEEQLRLSANGTVLDLPAGPVKAALGLELIYNHLYQTAVAPAGIGIGTVASSFLPLLNEVRKDAAAFVELDIPIIGPEANIPLVQEFEIDVAARYDSYDTLGNTANPKGSFDWTVVDGFKLRGSWSTSFVGPEMDIAGSKEYPGWYPQYAFGGTTQSADVPVAAFPAVTQLGIAGCTSASVTCNISNIQGVISKNGDANVKPLRGRSWTLGLDFNPSFLPGLTSQVTLWNNTVLGALTSPTITNVVYSSSLNSLLQFTPGCATASQIAALNPLNVPITSPLPACALYLYNNNSSNYLNLKIQGLDISFQYQLDTDTMGTFKFGDSLTQYLRFDQTYGVGASGVYFNVLGTNGANTAFPSVSTQMRVNLGWSFEGLEAGVFINYTGHYRNWSGNTVNLLTQDANRNTNGGGDPVQSNTTIDLHLSYEFSNEFFGEDEVSLTVRNIADSQPPYYNGARGYDTFIANPLGRIVTLALRAKY